MNFKKIAARIENVGEANFKAEVLESILPVLVVFWATWSHSCHILMPVIKKVSDECVGSVKVIKVDADDNPGLGLSYEVQFIPTLLLFVSGCERARITGTVSEAYILAKLQSVLTGGNSPTIISETNHLKRTP